jgi:ribonuclease HI
MTGRRKTSEAIIELPVSPDQKRNLEKAAERSGVSVVTYILTHALEAADQALAEPVRSAVPIEAAEVANQWVVIYTDGACKGNPGSGGWAAILQCGGHTKEISGGEAQTTNNRMEMMAVIQALKSLTRPCQVQLHTDSQLVVNTMTCNWKRKANLDLWSEIDHLATIHQIKWIWVRGHAGNPLNHRADQLAVAASRKFQRDS